MVDDVLKINIHTTSFYPSCFFGVGGFLDRSVAVTVFFRNIVILVVLFWLIRRLHQSIFLSVFCSPFNGDYVAKAEDGRT